MSNCKLLPSLLPVSQTYALARDDIGMHTDECVESCVQVIHDVTPIGNVG
jgi:hypothetical protein